MPPRLDTPALHIRIFPEPLVVFQLPPEEAISNDLLEAIARRRPGDRSFLSITRTNEETSIVTNKPVGPEQDVTTWRGLQLRGPLDFGLVGIMNDLTAPLKVADIPVYAISTWNTDYLLVPVEMFDQALAVLKEDGWTFIEPTSG